VIVRHYPLRCADASLFTGDYSAKGCFKGVSGEVRRHSGAGINPRP